MHELIQTDQCHRRPYINDTMSTMLSFIHEHKHDHHCCHTKNTLPSISANELFVNTQTSSLSSLLTYKCTITYSVEYRLILTSKLKGKTIPNVYASLTIVILPFHVE